MYNRDQSLIGAYARKSPENMHRVYAFVIATIQQPLDMVKEILEDVDKEGEASRFLWGWKADAWRFSRDCAEEVYASSMTLWDFASSDAEAEELLLGYFAGLPGLGLVKGGFMAQLCYGVSGCLDRHHVALNGLDERTFRASRYKSARTSRTRVEIVQTYSQTVAVCGGGPALWDTWCEHVSGLTNTFNNADEVSAYHWETIRK